MKVLLAPLLLFLQASFALGALAQDRVHIADEEAMHNDPDNAIACPDNAQKRTAVLTYRDLMLALGHDGPIESPLPKGYVFPEYLQLPKLKVPRNFLGFAKAGFSSIAVYVGENGASGKRIVVCSTGEPFEKAALNAVESAKFRPAIREGVPEASIVILPFRFVIE
jgi:hypothetical protein